MCVGVLAVIAFQLMCYTLICQRPLVKIDNSYFTSCGF